MIFFALYKLHSRVLLVQVQHCRNRLDVWAYPVHVGNIEGLCGHYSLHTFNDMTARDGMVYPLTPFPLAFSLSWRVGALKAPVKILLKLFIYYSNPNSNFLI